MKGFWRNIPGRILAIISLMMLLWIEQPNLPFGLADIWSPQAYHTALSLLGLALIVLCYPSSSITSTSIEQHDHTLNQTQWLNQLINVSFKRLRQHTQQYFWSLNHRTWLILGLDDIGRKALLEKNASCLTHPEDRLSWWSHGQDLFCLGAPRINLQQTLPHNAIIWSKLCQRLRFNRWGRSPFDELVLILHIPALHAPHEAHQARDIDQINAALSSILKYHPKTPCRIVFTQADHIVGFEETFSQFTPQQGPQPWSIDCTQGPQLGLAAYDTAFEQWIQALNHQMIQRLHQEPCAHRRQLIQHFPSQLQCLKTPIRTLLEQLCLGDPEQLKAIHFCSTRQTTQPFDYLTNQTHITTHTALTTPLHTDYPILCHQLFMPSASAQHIHKTRNTRPLRRSIIAWVFLTVFLTLNYAHYQWLKTAHRTATSQHYTWWIPSPQPQAPIWQHASILKQHLQILKTSTHVTQWLFPHTIQLRHQLNQRYHHVLKTKMIPTLDTLFSHQLNTSQPYLTRTSALLALNELSHTLPNKPTLFSKWITQQLGIHFDQSWQYELLNDLAHHFQINRQLNRQAQALRTTLSTLPIEHQVLLNTLATQPGTTTAFKIKHIYHPKSFNQFNQSIFKQQCAKQAADTQCFQRTKNLYIQYYLYYWTQLIEHPEHWLQPQGSTPNSYLKHYQSALTLINEALEQLNLSISSSHPLYASFKHLHQSWKTFILKQSNLQALLTSLDTPAPSTEKNAQAFKRLASQLNPSDATIKINDPLLTQWEAAVHIWIQDDLAHRTLEYLNTIWQQSLWPLYQTKIAPFYPFNPKSNQDLSLHTFESFLGPKGSLTQFMTHYIEPFADFDGQYWHWKTHAPQALKTQKLDAFDLTRWLQRAFFHQGNSPWIAFELIPSGLHSDIKQFKLNLGGQLHLMTRGNEPAISGMWPFPHHDDTTSIEFMNQAGEKTFLSAHGPWALFKLFRSTQLRPNLDNPRQFELTFKLHQYEAHYQLIVDEPLNPLSFQILSAFDLPEQLFPVKH